MLVVWHLVAKISTGMYKEDEHLSKEGESNALNVEINKKLSREDCRNLF